MPDLVSSFISGVSIQSQLLDTIRGHKRDLADAVGEFLRTSPIEPRDSIIFESEFKTLSLALPKSLRLELPIDDPRSFSISILANTLKISFRFATREGEGKLPFFAFRMEHVAPISLFRFDAELLQENALPITFGPDTDKMILSALKCIRKTLTEPGTIPTIIAELAKSFNALIDAVARENAYIRSVADAGKDAIYRLTNECIGALQDPYDSTRIKAVMLAIRDLCWDKIGVGTKIKDIGRAFVTGIGQKAEAFLRLQKEPELPGFAVSLGLSKIPIDLKGFLAIDEKAQSELVREIKESITTEIKLPELRIEEISLSCPGNIVSVNILVQFKPWDTYISRQFGCIQVEGVSIKVKSGDTLEFSLTGWLDLLGLRAYFDGLTCSTKIVDLFTRKIPAFSLDGLIIEADLGPINLAGTVKKTPDGWTGKLRARYLEYDVRADASFSPAEHSFCLFGNVNGPFGGGPAFFITGAMGGLGINSRFARPTSIEDVDNHAFFTDSPPAKKYQEPSTGCEWLAFGIVFTSFYFIEGKIIAILSFDAEASATIIGKAKTRDDASLLGLVNATLLINGSVDRERALLHGELKNAKFFGQDITGGFIAYLGIGDKERGRFLFTIGGLPPGVTRPDLPIIPRVGMQVSCGILTLKGEAYFAIGSEFTAAGFVLSARLELGMAWLGIRFTADFRLNFYPTFFRLEVTASIAAGIRFKIKVGIFKISVSMSLSLSMVISLSGPPIAGRICLDLDFLRISLPLPGGDEGKSPSPCSWESMASDLFQGKIISVQALRGLDREDVRGEAPQKTDSIWKLNPDFEIDVTTHIPFWEVNDDGDSTSIRILPMSSKEKDVILKRSSLSIVVMDKDRKSIETPKSFVKQMKATPNASIWKPGDGVQPSFFSGARLDASGTIEWRDPFDQAALAKEASYDLPSGIAAAIKKLKINKKKGRKI